MANPPTTIGPFTNVPAPGSPMRSDWPQSASTWIRDNRVFIAPSVAALKAEPDAVLGYVNVGPTGYAWADRPGKGQAWRATIFGTTSGATTDASGIITYTAAQMGFTTLEWVQAGVSWGAAVATPWLAQARIASNSMQVRVMNVMGGGTISAAVSTAVTVHYSARGIL